ncbi:histidinol-phosphate transaminase [Ascosphaera aggregata]|nr:histidinol-phosphate transaminase [Ascosphaera aggregata]
MALSPSNLAIMTRKLGCILEQRDRLVEELPKLSGVGRFLGGRDSNFLLVEILDKPAAEGGKPCNIAALATYQALAEQKGVVVRFRGKEYGCNGCLRITVGTEKEVTRFLADIKNVLSELYARAQLQYI